MAGSLQRMDHSDVVLLRYRLHTLGNVLRAGLARGRRLDSVVVTTGGALLLAYWCGTLLERLGHVAWCRSHPAGLSAGLLAYAVASGALAADRDVNRSRRLANAAFLSVLPWSDGSRRRAMRLACAPAGCAGTLFTFLVIYAVTRACGAATCLLSAMAGSALFGSANALTVLASLRRARLPSPTRRTIGGTGRAGAAVLRGLSRFDSGAPRWLGSWALGRRAPGLAAAWSFLLITLGLGAAAGGIVERSAGPAVGAAVVGGHAVFLIGLRARPLVSGALRLQPTRFLSAVWGVARLPLLASAAWFCLPAFSAFAATGSPSGQVAAGGVCLILLDLMFLVIAVSLPRSPRAAEALHLGALAIGAQNLARFGIFAESALLLAFLAHRLRRARRAFHV